MSQPLQMQLVNASEWLSQETKLLVEQIRENASSLLIDITERVDDTKQNSQRIFENSQKEMDKNNPKTYRFARNAHEFAQDLIEALETASVPNGFNYEKLQAFCGDMEKLLTSTEQQRSEEYPHISPYFIFDRRRLDASLKRLTDIINELRNSLTEKFAEAKAVEDVHSQIDKLLQTTNEDSQTQEMRRQTEARAKTLGKEIAEIQQRIAQIQAEAKSKELVQLTHRIEELRENIRHRLSHLQKPFSKLQSLAKTGEIAVPLDEMNSLDDYLKDPFTALTMEEEGYSLLRSILKRIDAAMADGNLKLKSTRIRKAQNRINNILTKDSLIQLQKQCKETLSRKKELMASGTITELQNQLTQFQSQLKELQREIELINSKNELLKTDQEKLMDKIEYQKKELEKNIFQLTNQSVQIVLVV